MRPYFSNEGPWIPRPADLPAEAAGAGLSGTEALVGRSPRPPWLLVSVRSAAEARAALAGGCDILDVKEPSRGSLGMADPRMTADVLSVAGDWSEADRVPVTAALGEANEWLHARFAPAVPSGVSFVKLGLAGLGEEEWIAAWCGVRGRFEEAATRPLEWIAVAYGDWESAAAPRPEAVVEAAIETRCGGVLFDTHQKNGRNLLDFIAIGHLRRLAESIRCQGLLVALAGRLTADLLTKLGEFRPDVIAIRGAACRSGCRTGEVAAGAVTSFRSAMQRVWRRDPVGRSSGQKNG